MRKINISNAKKRDAMVGFEAKPHRRRVFQVLQDGSSKRNLRILRSTPRSHIETLAGQHEDLEALGQALIQGDPDVDLDYTGMLLEGLKKVYVGGDGEVVFHVHIEEVIKDPHGEEKERKPFVPRQANIAVEEVPLRWTGKLIPKAAAVRKFVFSRHYQIHHVNGLTYDFLYAMAKELHEKQALMFMGAGPKGNEALVVSRGGSPYRAFLEGRVQGEKYLLILHLTHLELKELPDA